MRNFILFLCLSCTSSWAQQGLDACAEKAGKQTKVDYDAAWAKIESQYGAVHKAATFALRKVIGGKVRLKNNNTTHDAWIANASRITSIVKKSFKKQIKSKTYTTHFHFDEIPNLHSVELTIRSDKQKGPLLTYFSSLSYENSNDLKKAYCVDVYIYKYDPVGDLASKPVLKNILVNGMDICDKFENIVKKNIDSQCHSQVKQVPSVPNRVEGGAAPVY